MSENGFGSTHNFDGIMKLDVTSFFSKWATKKIKYSSTKESRV